MGRRHLLVLLLGLVSPGCVTERPLEPDYGPFPVRELERWQIRRGDRTIGQMVLIEIRHPDQAVRRYEVRNHEGQWLGFVDLQGRVYQRVPFSMAEVFRGVHTMQRGLALLYEQEGPLAIQPMEPGGGAPKEASLERREER